MNKALPQPHCVICTIYVQRKAVTGAIERETQLRESQLDPECTGYERPQVKVTEEFTSRSNWVSEAYLRHTKDLYR